MFFPKIERSSKEEIKKFQESKIFATLSYLNNNSKFYSALFTTHQIDINSIKTIEALSKIPFTTKDDVQAHNTDFICVNKKKIIDSTLR